MTGLNPDVDHIMEAACLVTDSELNTIGEGVDLVINQPDSILDGMNDWCKDHHSQVQRDLVLVKCINLVVKYSLCFVFCCRSLD